MRIHNYRRNKFIFIAAMGMMLLSGCGKNTKDIALITDKGLVEEGSVESTAWESIEKFAKNNDKTYAAYEPEERNTKGYEEAINEALKSGAEVIICPGSVFETAVYDMQKEDLSVKFLILDGVPNPGDSKKEKLRGNTHAVLFSKEQAGFLAGYSAVKEGNTNLGFMGGVKDNETTRYGSGFVQGANAAAVEMGLNADQITIRYGYLGTKVTSPTVTQTAQTWYDEGCQVIFGCDSSILNAIGKAAESRDKLVITLDNDLSAFPDRVLAYIGNDYGSVVYQVLDSIEEKKYAGGEMETVGIESNSVYLDMSRSSFGTFTEEQYLAVCNDLKTGKLKVTDVNVTKDLSKYEINNVAINKEK